MRFVAALVLLFSSAAWASPILTLGAGMESRINASVNPDANDINNYGELYMSLAQHPWSFLWELERSETTTANGNYSVTDVEYTTMVWARYEPWSGWWKVSPYFGAGLGYQIDDLTSRFGRATDTRWGEGGGIGALSTGIMANFFQHWNVEGEARVAKYEMQNGPTWSVLLRSGYTF